MAGKVVAKVMNNDKNSVTEGDCNGADGDSGHGPIACCEVVMALPI